MTLLLVFFFSFPSYLPEWTPITFLQLPDFARLHTIYKDMNINLCYRYSILLELAKELPS